MNIRVIYNDDEYIDYDEVAEFGLNEAKHLHILKNNGTHYFIPHIAYQSIVVDEYSRSQSA